MGRRWHALVMLYALAWCSVAVESSIAGDEPRPPVLADPSMATGTLTIPFRNVTGNAIVYYNFADRGVRTDAFWLLTAAWKPIEHPQVVRKLRVDQDAGGGQIHTYIGDWKTGTSTFILSQKPLLCYSSPNPNAVPDPQFFRSAQFMGRVQINGVLTQHWCTTSHSQERGCSREHPHRPGQIDLFVREGSYPAEPVRMNFWGWQLDFATFKPGFSGDPKVWEIPSSCGRAAATVEEVFTMYAATLKR